jgi:phage repressor protein C with HTH and peptisase S24 domain
MGILGDWQRVRVSGLSMTPTLRDGDLVLVRHGVPIRPGDVVLAQFRRGPEVPVLKRAVREEDGGWILSSDNRRAGSDSARYGIADVQARVCWIWQGRLRGAHLRPAAIVRAVLGRRPQQQPPGQL